MVPFKMFPFQSDCVDAFQTHRNNIVLKSRQLGLSTVAAAYCTWLSIFYKDKSILAVATKLPTAQNFIKKVKVMVANLPPWLVIPQIKTESRTEITFDNGSMVKAVPTSLDAGRSEALSCLIIDEAAHIRGFEDLWAGLAPTLSTGGQSIIISTPNGVGGQYYKIWQDAENGISDFNPIRLPWNVHPERDQKWFENQCRVMGSRRKINQELLCDFISSGDTFLASEDIDWLRSEIREPTSKEGYERNVWVWEQPKSGARYVISADVSRGDANDYSAFHVIDYDASTVVAEFIGKISPDQLADLLEQYGIKYNNALICPENNVYGFMTLMALKSKKYPRIFYKAHRGDMFNYVPLAQNEEAGFSTQKNTRDMILTKTEEIIRKKEISVPCRRTFEQLQAFVWIHGKAKAGRDAHDDLVISLAIGIWLLDGGQTKVEDSSEIMSAMLSAMNRERRIQPSFNNEHMNNMPCMTSNVPHDQRVSFMKNNSAYAAALNVNWLLK
jgi:hypothetical protein